MEQSTPKNSRIIPASKWNEFHMWPPIGGMRHLIFHADTNGFARCIIRAGRRVLIDEEQFYEWLREQKDRA